MLRLVDLSSTPYAGIPSPPGVIVAHGSGADIAQAESWLDTATFTLTEDPCADRRVITVDSVPDALADLSRRGQRWPHAGGVCDDVLRAVDPGGPTLAGVVTESLAYSTLQAGPEFARWLAERGPARMPEIADPVQAQRDGHILRITFNRPQRHNAFSTDARAALLEALTVAQLDPSVTGIVLSGNGPSFCSGGDLAEFGAFTDPASAHLARTRHSPALALDAVTSRLGREGRVRRPDYGRARCSIRFARAEPRLDSRGWRHGQRDPADRTLAHSLFGAERVDHRRRDRRGVGPRGYERLVMAHKATVEL